MNRDGEAVLEDVLGCLGPGLTTIDGGAHHGIWACALSRCHKDVYAYEPQPETFAALAHNLRAYPNARPICKALGWVVGHKVRLGFRLTGKSDTARIEQVGAEAESTSIDHEEHRHVSFIKLDLEGFEYFALRGAQRTILRDRPVILIEEKDGLPQHFGLQTYAAREWLLSLGMRILRQYKIDTLFGWPHDSLSRRH